MRSFYVYIVTNKSGTLYIGVTNDLGRRVYEHRQAGLRGFTKRYKIDRLVYYEESSNAISAIEREKQTKGWLRRRKMELITNMNPRWLDLAETWFDEGPDPSLRSG